ncbi:MAG: cupin domain-containing protein [Chloroflexi bacterium]|nr:cupin domain-containing protein [Chloroflexota bacterium]
MPELFWDVQKVAKEKTPSPKEPITWTYMHQGKYATLNIVQALTEIKPHIHKDHDEVVYIFSGKGKFTIGDITHDIGPGTVYFVPAGVVHGGKIENGVAVSTYAPFFDFKKPDRVWVSEQK